MAKLPRRKCANKECREWFHPTRDGQIVCSYQCASAVGKEQTMKAREAAQRKELTRQHTAEKIERAAWRQRKAAVKPLKHWVDLTQRAVNDICRETELAEGKGCISCGTKKHLPGTLAITGLRLPPGTYASRVTISISSATSAIPINRATLRPTAPRWWSFTVKQRFWNWRTTTHHIVGRLRN